MTSSSTDTNSSLPYQYLSNSLDKNGLSQQQLFAWKSLEVRNPKGSRKGFQFASSITQEVHRVSWHFERGSSQDYLTKNTGLQGELTNFKSGSWRLLEMTIYKVYNKTRLQEAFTDSLGEVLPYEIAITETFDSLRMDQ